jgi:hypothetical protein
MAFVNYIYNFKGNIFIIMLSVPKIERRMFEHRLLITSGKLMRGKFDNWSEQGKRHTFKFLKLKERNQSSKGINS